MDICSCSICLEVVRPDPIQCVNDHLLCRECKGDLTKCPTCRQPFSNATPSRVLTQVIGMLPKLCKHKNCGKLFGPGDDHERFCGYNVTVCMTCEWEGPCIYLLEHLELFHSDTILYQATETIKLREFDPEKELMAVSYFILNDYIIWVFVQNVPVTKKFHTSCFLVPNGKPIYDVLFKVSFLSPKSELICKIKINPDPKLQHPEENAIFIPWFSLREFIDSNQELSFIVDFTFEESDKKVL